MAICCLHAICRQIGKHKAAIVDAANLANWLNYLFYILFIFVGNSICLANCFLVCNGQQMNCWRQFNQNKPNQHYHLRFGCFVEWRKSYVVKINNKRHEDANTNAAASLAILIWLPPWIANFKFAFMNCGNQNWPICCSHQLPFNCQSICGNWFGELNLAIARLQFQN